MKVEINDSKFIIDYDGDYYNIRDENGGFLRRTHNVVDAIGFCDLIARKVVLNND